MESNGRSQHQGSEPFTKARLIVIVGSEDILSTSIYQFLSAKEDWKVVGVSNREALDALLLAEDSRQVDVILIANECQPEITFLPPNLFQDYTTLRVITVTLKNNMLEVYSKETFMLRQTADLIRVIESMPDLFQES